MPLSGTANSGITTGALPVGAKSVGSYTETGITAGNLSATATGGTLTIAGATLTNAGATLTNTGSPVVIGTSVPISELDTLTLNSAGEISVTSATTQTIPVPLSLLSIDPSTFADLLDNAGWVTKSQVGSIGSLSRSSLNFVLFGSHHRILQDNGLTDSGSGFWVTGDYAHHDPSDTNATIGEFGFYKDIGNDIRLGLGAGVNQACQTLPVNGSGKLDSRYVVIEGDFGSFAEGWVGSITGFAGSNSATISRGYLVGVAPNLSNGVANGSSWAIRVRSDWSNVGTLADLSVSPYFSYTHAVSRLDAYTESGGTLPVAFSAQRQTSNEIRGGMTLISKLSAQTDLRFPLELAHRKNVGATITGVAAGIPFSFSNAGTSQTWGRAGIEMDHHMSAETVLNGAIITASQGGDSSWLATVSLRHAF